MDIYLRALNKMRKVEEYEKYFPTFDIIETFINGLSTLY